MTNNRQTSQSFRSNDTNYSTLNQITGGERVKVAMRLRPL
jgi:hypothetical protein